ncbi:nuclear transport factor 2 family protein [Arthrobacter sp. IA7]|uniref:YybH family protein n=1 Tax=Arthrobacter ipis TaxID=2716202 RepID=UPI001683E73A|nr:nuclear transport factor 2 family protein [Arthrobacter ipis]MBD1541337.1 nuclear transport factor 2 family protein [Arthrobacter ipis]
MDLITTAEVESAAQRLMTAFAATDTDRYFDCFAPDATFVFHSEPDRLSSRGEYRSLWQRWLEDGWRVAECASSNAHIQIAGPLAVFSHDVETVIDVSGTKETLLERETIIFARTETGRVLAIHEHLSSSPVSSKAI